MRIFTLLRRLLLDKVIHQLPSQLVPLHVNMFEQNKYSSGQYAQSELTVITNGRAVDEQINL